MKIVLVLALVLGVALFPEKGQGTTTPEPPKQRCYSCRNEESCAALTKKKLENRTTIVCETGICTTRMEHGKISARGCFWGDSQSSAGRNISLITERGNCLITNEAGGCYADGYQPDACKKKDRKRRDDVAAGSEGGASSEASAETPGTDEKKPEQPAGNPDTGSGANSDPRTLELRGVEGLKSLICLKKGNLSNLELPEKTTKCYECFGTAVEGKDEPCVVLDKEKVKEIVCPGEYCGIYKEKMPGKEKGATIMQVTRGCAVVSKVVHHCYEKQGEQIDTATCAIGTLDEGSTSTAVKVKKCLDEKRQGTVDPEYSRFGMRALYDPDTDKKEEITREQLVGYEIINCICSGDLCNDAGKGSHLVVSNGVIMLGLMMKIARTGKLI